MLGDLYGDIAAQMSHGSCAARRAWIVPSCCLLNVLFLLKFVNFKVGRNVTLRYNIVCVRLHPYLDLHLRRCSRGPAQPPPPGAGRCSAVIGWPRGRRPRLNRTEVGSLAGTAGSWHWFPVEEGRTFLSPSVAWTDSSSAVASAKS